MKKNFELFIQEVLTVEGGYVNDPDDRGGATNRGITYVVYEKYYEEVYGLVSSEEDHVNLSRKEAEEIYRYYYWDMVLADELPSGVDMLVADMAVNSGVSAASMLLQRAVNAEADGMIGPKTLAKVNAIGTNMLIHKVFLARREAYFNIAALRNNQKFYKGWINRLNHIYDTAHKLVYGG
jgi:lysozyme family protein